MFSLTPGCLQPLPCKYQSQSGLTAPEMKVLVVPDGFLNNGQQGKAPFVAVGGMVPSPNLSGITFSIKREGFLPSPAQR